MMGGQPFKELDVEMKSETTSFAAPKGRKGTSQLVHDVSRLTLHPHT